MAEKKFSLKKAGGFQLGSGNSLAPVFSESGRHFAALVGNRADIWELATRARVASCKSKGLVQPGGLALDHDASRIAMRNEEGLIDVVDVATGELVRRIRRGGQCGCYLLLDADGSRIIEASSGDQAGLYIWHVETGDLVEEYDCGFDYMPTGLSRARSGTVVACMGGKLGASELGEHDYLWIWSEDSIRKLQTGLEASTASISPDGQCIFLAGRTRSGLTVFRMLDCSGNIICERNMGLIRTFPCLNAQWSPDGLQLAWDLDSVHGEAALLNAKTLEITDKVAWPQVKLALGPNGWVAIAGEKGVVVPRSAVADAVAFIGKPVNDFQNMKSAAFHRSIEIGRNKGPRVTVFLDEGDLSLRIEAEQWFDQSQYLPIEGESTVLFSLDAERVGQSVRDALGKFRLLNTSAKLLGMPVWYDERPSNRFEPSVEQWQEVRTLCFSGRKQRGVDGFVNPHVGKNARCLVITHYDGNLDLWPATTSLEGRFVEDTWPHILLSDEISNVGLGEAVMAEFSKCVVGDCT